MWREHIEQLPASWPTIGDAAAALEDSEEQEGPEGGTQELEQKSHTPQTQNSGGKLQ
jgi:hypothetical protein